MGRTIKNYQFEFYPQGIINAVHDYLVSEGYVYKERKGENVYQKGSGLMMGPTFIKVTLMNNRVRLETWQKFAILPALYVGEFDLDSFLGVAVKGPLKKRFAYLESIMLHFGGFPIVENMLQQPVFQQPVNQPAYHRQTIRYAGQNICRNCGAVLEGDARFCAVCGSKV